MNNRLIAIIGAAAVAGCASITGGGASAGVEMKPTQGNNANGTISFTQRGADVVAHVQMAGLTPGVHGIHIHERGDCSAPDGTSAGGHFNPHGSQHGAPEHAAHHAGDFGNLTADAAGNATADIVMPAPHISLAADAANSIVGKAVIVHADPDDFKTQPTGNSGKRVACGVIAAK